MGDTVQLSVLLDTLLQKAYNDLTNLQELLPQKSDGERKLEIVQYARRTRGLVIRLLGLVKWAGNSKSLEKSSEMSRMLNEQSWLYVNTADQLANLSRGVLVQACTPNFTLAPAVDVVTAGTYSRLPTCIRDKIVPLPPLSADQSEEVFFLIDCAIRHRLLVEHLPNSLSVKSIGQGIVTFEVPYEFELGLSVVGDDNALPWRLVSLKLLVGNSFPGNPVLVHEMQRVYLHQLIQSRLCAPGNTLADCYQCLHAFCLSLQLDCLHSQAIRLSSELYGGHVKVEDYQSGCYMTLVYWMEGTSNQSQKSWPKVTISADAANDGNPFTTSHIPPLPQGSKVNVTVGDLSVESVLEGCVSARMHMILSRLKDGLSGTAWEKDASLHQSPLSLCVCIPLKYSTRTVLIGVDPRVGHVVVLLDPSCLLEGVSGCLEKMEKSLVTTLDKFPELLDELQCQLFLAYISECANDLGYEVHHTLPILHPLSFQGTLCVYVQIQPLRYLTVSVGKGLTDHYYLVTLEPSSPLSVDNGDVNGLQLFLQVTNVLELDPEQVYFNHLKRVLVQVGGSLLKRKLKETDLDLPSKKRFCFYRSPLFAPLPTVINSRLTLQDMQTSLRNASIIPHHVTYTRHGAPSLNIFEFPLEVMESQDLNELLSSHLQTCHVTKFGHDYICTFVFSSILDNPQSKAVVLHQTIPSEPACDLGQTLLAQWRSRLVLLGLALELQHHIQDHHYAQSYQWEISSFTYDQLTVSFGDHSMSIDGLPDGLRLSFSEDCPHSLLTSDLEQFLSETRSLPLLLKGISGTCVVMAILYKFIKRISVASIAAVTPSQIQLQYINLVLSITLQDDGSVLFTDLTFNKPTSVMASSLPIPPLTYLKVFLQTALERGGTHDPDEPALPLTSASSVSTKPTLQPAPSPITHPRPSAWAAPSPRELSIPSIPPLGSYSSPGSLRGGVAPKFDGWRFTSSLEEYRTLMADSENGPSKMERFLGCLSLLFHFIYIGTKTSNQQQQPLLQFFQSDRGTCTYRSDNLNLSLRMEGGSLKLTLKPGRDNVWTQNELDTLSVFFHTEVVSPPFAVNGMTSFIHLIKFPIPSLKGLVHLLKHHLSQPLDVIWDTRVCLTLPDSSCLAGTPFQPGHQGIILSKKLIIFLELTRKLDGYKLLVPIIHDTKSNDTYVVKSQSNYLLPVHVAVDSILKKAVAECNSGQNPGQTSSLYPALSVLSKSQLPTS